MLRYRCLPRRTIPRYGRQLGEHGEYASPAHVPETVVVTTITPQATGKQLTVAADKTNNPYGGGNVPRLDGPQKLHQTSKDHMHSDTSVARPPSTTASPIAECTATKATSSPVFVSQVPLHETAVVAVCAMAVIAATVIGPVHRVPRYL